MQYYKLKTPYKNYNLSKSSNKYKIYVFTLLSMGVLIRDILHELHYISYICNITDACNRQSMFVESSSHSHSLG